MQNQRSIHTSVYQGEFFYFTSEVKSQSVKRSRK